MEEKTKDTSVRKQVYSAVTGKINMIAGMAQSGKGKEKAILANMRRGVGKASGDIPETWGVVFKDINDDLIGPGGSPSFAEEAIYQALTLYSLHQQGHDIQEESVQGDKIPFGKAVAKLIDWDDEGSQERIQEKLRIAASAQDTAVLSHRIRQLIQLMKKGPVKLDYGRLAVDFYDYNFPESRKEVRHRWARDYFMEINKISRDRAQGSEKQENQK